MAILPDALLDNSLLHDAFDFSQHSALKIRNPKASNDKLRHRVRGRTLPGRHGSPYRAILSRKSRNVSEPQLSSLTKHTRKPWLMKFPTVHTVEDIASLIPREDDNFSIRSSQSTTLLYDTPDVRSFGNDDLQKMSRTPRADLSDILWNIETSGYRSEESLYSMDSADHDAHPLLLSMPVIPQIKLERKATVRKLESAPFVNAVRNQTYLFPRIPDIRTPARLSSRRYGRILSPPSAPVSFSDVPLDREHDKSRIPRCRSTSWSDLSENPTAAQGYQRSASEPALNCPLLDDEQEPTVDKGINESPDSDLLLSIIDDVGASPVPHGDCLVSDVCEVPSAKRSHQRSSMSHSISLSGLFHAVVDGYTSLDQLLRKPKTKSKATTTEPKLTEPQLILNAYDMTSKWAPREGQILIKVFVPSTDDIWMFRVPQDITLVDFTSRVVTKLGFVVSFSGSVWDEPKYHFRTDEQFKPWVKGRIRFGRNLPVVAHVLAPLPLVRLSVDADGCEVWCYA